MTTSSDDHNPELRRVFISCDYRHDGEYRDKFLEMDRYWKLFSKAYMRDDVSDHLESDRKTVLKDIRTRYIKDATVLILLCGKDTRYCPYVDRELCSAMTNNYDYSKLGMLVISLPDSGNGECPSRQDRYLLDRYSSFEHPQTMYEISKLMPGLPMRVVDSIRQDCPISVISWEHAAEDHGRLLELIDRAHLRRSTNRYDNSGQMKQ